MSKKLSGILTIVAGLIGLIAFYFFFKIVQVGDDTIINDVEAQASIVSPFISFAKFVFIATLAVTVVFSILNLVKSPTVLKRTLIGLAVMGVVLAVAYSMASDAAVTDGLGKVLPEGEAGSVSKWVSTLINYSFILGAVGLILVLVDFLKGLVK